MPNPQAVRVSSGRELCCALWPGRAWHFIHLGLKEEDGNCSVTVIIALCFKARHRAVGRCPAAAGSSRLSHSV